MKNAVLTLIAFAFIFSLNANAKKEKNAWQKKRYKITNQVVRKKVPFLKFHQLAKLEYWERVRYVEKVRQAVLDADSIQKKFKVRHASNFPHKSNELWALLFSQPVHANNYSHDRGGKISDQCIASATLSTYRKGKGGKAKYSPFGCAPVECKTAAANGVAQLKCGFAASGLSGNNACVPKININKSGIRRHSPTEDCWEKSQNLYKRNKSSNDQYVTNLLQKIEELKRSGKSAKIWLTSADAQETIKHLKEHAYDPRMMAHLIGLTQEFKRYRIKFPESLEGEWNRLVKGVDNMLADFQGHCDKPLTKRSINDILNKKRVDSWGKGWIGQKELYRYREAKKLMEQKGRSTATVREVLQVPECKVVDRRIASIKEYIHEANGTYPILPHDPVPVTPGPGDEDIKPNDPPEPPPTAKTSIESLGCTFTSAKDHHIPQTGMRCASCAAERAMINKTGDGSYHVSRKWLSLLSTMALVCGDGCFGGRDNMVSAEVATEYIQSFGHCGSTDYDWQSLSGSDERLVKKWGKNGSFVKYLSKNNVKKINQDFQRIYGATLDDLTRTFCNMDNHKSWHKTRGSCKKNKPESLSKRVSRRRSNMKKAFKGSFGRSMRLMLGLDKKFAPDLQECMKSSYQNMELLYSGSDNQCMKVLPYNEALKPKVLQQAKANMGNMLMRNGICSVPKQIEYDRGESTRLVWVQPNKLNKTPFGQKEDVYRSIGNYYELLQQKPSAANRFSDVLNSQGIPVKFLPRKSAKFRVMVQDSSACPPNSKSSNSGGHNFHDDGGNR